MGCPALWTQIHLSWESGDLFEDSLERPFSYISACLERSQDLLLDMDLNFESFPTSDDITDTNDAIIDASYIENVVNTSWEWDLGFDSAFYCWLFNRFFDHLAGVNGRRMKRWSRLRLAVGYDDGISTSIWKRLRGSLPNLKTLYVTGFPRTDDDDEYDVSIFSQSLIDLSTVTSLTALGTPLFTSFPLSNSNLRHLDIWFNSSLADLIPLPSFPQLQALKLHGFPMLYSPTDPPPTIRLPKLEELTLSGYYSPLCDLTDAQKASHIYRLWQFYEASEFIA